MAQQWKDAQRTTILDGISARRYAQCARRYVQQPGGVHVDTHRLAKGCKSIRLSPNRDYSCFDIFGDCMACSFLPSKLFQLLLTQFCMDPHSDIGKCVVLGKLHGMVTIARQFKFRFTCL